MCEFFAIRVERTANNSDGSATTVAVIASPSCRQPRISAPNEIGSLINLWVKQQKQREPACGRFLTILDGEDWHGGCCTIERRPDVKGDRVKLILSGKFLPYKEH
jgi:hypothetical protein